jgi:transcription antitermination factor NusG
VYWLGRPAVIKEAEITAIKRFLNDYQNVQLERASVNVADTVRIIQGPLLSMEGSVVEVMTHSVKVLLPSLGFTLTAQVERSHIEKVFTPTDKEASLHKAKTLN